MYGNTGDVYIQVSPLSIGSLFLNGLGQKFIIGEYYSVPHGFVALKVKDEMGTGLLYIPDNLFKECFVKEEVYNSYYGVGDVLGLRITDEKGNLIQTGKYSVTNITKDGLIVYLKMKKMSKLSDENNK